MLPDSWRVLKLADVAKVKTGPFGSSLHESDYVLIGTPILTVEHLGARGLTRQNLPLVAESDVRRLAAYKCRTGDILFSRVGSVDRNALVSSHENGWLFSGRLLRVRVTDSKILPEFLSYQMADEKFKNRVRAVAVGQTMPSLNTQILNNLPIFLPSLSEQQQITEALSDADSAIAGLERLIAKKQEIKQAMMQQLLTGNVRLSGFHSEWESKALADLVNIRTGRPKPKVATGGRYWIVDMGSVTRDGSFVVSKKTNERSDFLRVNDLIMPKDDIGGGLIIGRTGRIDADETYVLADHVFALTSKGADSEYLNYAINSHPVNSSLRAQATGSAQLGLSKRSVHQQRIPVPDIGEQKAIALTLRSIDLEISALRRHLSKLNSIKISMMQELLAGRIRLTSKRLDE